MKFYTKEDLRDSRLFFDKQPANYLRYLSYFMLLFCLSSVAISHFLIKNYIVKASGTIESVDKAFVTPLVNGEIRSIEKSEGTQVKQGDILLKLSTGTNGVETNEINKQVTLLEDKKISFDLYQKSLTDKKNFLKNSGVEQAFYGKVAYYLSQVKDDEKMEKKNQSDRTNKTLALKDLENELVSINATANKDYQKKYGRKAEDLKVFENKLDSLKQEQALLKQSLDGKTSDVIMTIQSEITSKQLEIDTQLTTITTTKRELEDVIDSADSELIDKIKVKQEEINTKKSEIDELTGQNSRQSDNMLQQLMSELGTIRTENEDKISELNAQKNLKSSNDTLTNLTADKDGKVHYLALVKNGLGIQAFEPIAQITTATDKNLMVEAYISAQDRTKIKLKDSVKVSLNGVNTSKYGLLKGVVNSISDGTLTQTVGNEQQLFYQVNITLKNQSLTAKDDQIQVNASMPVTADIVYDKETYWQWLIKQLNLKQ
ncbi:HlyD family efflux transporter periplasmic adaptor subunit [Lactococcus piscium]|uniref:AprE-like beta-barrel domain-containing protein n=1 Tax=Pseudolactococcus paracarnosus TaxID=2749962 RepID=A0A7L4WCS3_9LACT|nr:HlyD family efflux transporter periplasmic adaptor subunit [Lactococcus paracarnosus]MCJ1993965.1 HlyD family efflux transporter periplasmic adaptor subunit [Lactococcus paracarnosus]QDJ28128.1 hypothetical protein BHS01_06120 [Lactococcus paracarnosus]SPC35482.1 Bacteriocin secretion accessory protein [Lactococcus piscium]